MRAIEGDVRVISRDDAENIRVKGPERGRLKEKLTWAVAKYEDKNMANWKQQVNLETIIGNGEPHPTPTSSPSILNKKTGCMSTLDKKFSPIEAADIKILKTMHLEHSST